ncbi:hypothetical protein RUND412_009667 [Rhizina undulata]
MVDAALLQKANLVMHVIQGVWIVVVLGVITTSLLQPGNSSGQESFMFTLCWLSIPGLIYLTQTPRFPRTKMFAHPYWIIGINTIYVILWFASFVALAVFTSNGIAAGVANATDPAIKSAGGCAVFFNGTGQDPKACTMNQAASGLGAIMWLFWLATFGIALWSAIFFSKNRVSPFEDLTEPSNEIQETTKDAFSSSDEYALINKHDQDDDVESAHQSAHSEHSIHSSPHMRTPSVSSYEGSYDQPYGDAHPGRPVSWGAGAQPYGGIGGHAPVRVDSVEMPIAPNEPDYSYRGPNA